MKRKKWIRLIPTRHEQEHIRVKELSQMFDVTEETVRLFMNFDHSDMIKNESMTVFVLWSRKETVAWP